VVSILVIADLTRGTGRFNVTQGTLAAAVGIGASFSTTLAGYLAQRASYSVSFLCLAAIAAVAWILLFLLVPESGSKMTTPAAGIAPRLDSGTDVVVGS
jgi:MFS family permease